MEIAFFHPNAFEKKHKMGLPKGENMASKSETAVSPSSKPNLRTHFPDNSSNTNAYAVNSPRLASFQRC